MSQAALYALVKAARLTVTCECCGTKHAWPANPTAPFDLADKGIYGKRTMRAKLREVDVKRGRPAKERP